MGAVSDHGGMDTVQELVAIESIVLPVLSEIFFREGMVIYSLKHCSIQ
jgi:hypothetical protein